jgi:phosphoenolpyruvate-protein kinase (PTS system EI component)
LVATSLLPTELPLLTVAALITETGGPLGHVATLARESGLPAIVGVVGAVARLAEDQLVIVDADAGIIVPTTTIATTQTEP